MYIERMISHPFYCTLNVQIKLYGGLDMSCIKELNGVLRGVRRDCIERGLEYRLNYKDFLVLLDRLEGDYYNDNGEFYLDVIERTM